MAWLYRRYWLSVAVGFLALGLSGLGAVGAHAESVLRIAMTAGDIPDWTGQPDQGFEGYRFVAFDLYDGLVNWDLSHSDREAVLRPGLATKWYPDPGDPKKWIFELRRGVTFHDGCAWNADEAIWNFTRLTSDKSPAFNPVQFARARSRTNNIGSVEKIDDHTIAIHTKTVESMFPYNLPFVLMVSKCALDKAQNDYAAYAKAPAGTGPYKFDKVVPHERLELVKNADYWDKSRIPKQDRVVLLPMPEASTRVAALLSGQVDFIEAPPPDALDRLKSAGMKIVTNVYPHTWPYLLNFMRGPFRDLRVRQAANYAVNRDDMVEMLNGVAVPSYGIYVPSQQNYGHPFEYKTDPAKATALLKQAGCYPCEIHIAISPSGSGQMQPLPMNELVKEQLESVGFKVDFDTIDWNTMITVFIQGAVKYPQYDGINFSSGATDPINFLKGFMTRYRSPLGSNWGGYSNPQVDDLAQQALTTFDPAQQHKLLARIHELVVKDAVRVFIVSDLNPRALSPKLSGFVQAQSWFQDITPIVVAP
ncbi:MAG TPA: ABC transporter substrate-binding protein [Stellaceae bacterium]|nr:ABC transporter substrate-binding protein [Stellaceae bacterium]